MDPVQVHFAEVDISGITGDPKTISELGFHIQDGEVRPPHLLTPWCRSQLLSTVGTKEKWFQGIDRKIEADELNLRLRCLRDHRLRVMKTPHDELGILRGLVSRHYADIPDTDIMNALCESMPDGVAIDRMSQKTDRAFYAYAMNQQEISIPGTLFRGTPGIVVKNSEVGYSSLWMIPTISLAGYSHPIVFEKKPLLRRAHRGSVDELKKLFDEKLTEAKVVWADMPTKLAALARITFVTEDEAVRRLDALVDSCGGTKLMAQRAEAAFRAQANHTFTAEGLFRALLDTITVLNADIGFTEASIAGAALWQLTT